MNKDMLEKLSAYLDGELTVAEQREIDFALESDPEMQAMLESLSRADSSLRPAYAAILNAPVPDRFTEILAEPTQYTHPKWTGIIRQLFRTDILAGATAALIVGLIAGSTLIAQVPQSSDGVFMAETGEIFAGKSLTAILAKNRSGRATEADGREFVIRMSFITGDGTYCREFRSRGAAGIACLNNDGWKIEAIGPNPAPPSDHFSMAGETPSEISASLSRLGVAEALDADGEISAIENGWK